MVLALATRFAETDASSWDRRYTWQFPPGRLIQIDIDPAEIGRNYPVEIGAVADVEPRRAGDRRPRSATGSPRRRRGRSCGRPSPRPAARCSPSSRERGAQRPVPAAPRADPRRSARALPADAILVTDVGWNKNGVAQCYELPAEGRFITPGGASTMGFGPAAAVGVQIARPDRTVVALIGDGGMSAQLPARADGRRAGRAGDLRRDEQPVPRHHLRPAGGELRPQLRLRLPGPGRRRRTAPTSPRSAAPAVPTATPSTPPADLGDGAARRHRRPAARRCWTCPWSTSRCPPPATGTSRTSTRASSSRTSVNRPNPDPGTGEAGRRRARGGRPWQTGCSSSTDRT